MEHKQKKLPGAAVRAVVEQMASETDPLGSYTGRPFGRRGSSRAGRG